MGTYLFGDAGDLHGPHFDALSALLDAGTFARVEQLGVANGWRCLEVGGGGGSVANWLADVVAPSGHVTVTDLDVARLEERDNVTVLEHDVVSNILPGNAFDLVHARLVLFHLPARDAVLRPEDVTLAERDPDRLPQGYVTTPAEVAGMRLRRAVPAGSVVTPAMLVAVPLISSGQQVTLEAGGDDMHIRMAGEALADAGLGQRVRVRNLSSERVVEGIVRSAQVVEVLLK